MNLLPWQQRFEITMTVFFYFKNEVLLALQIIAGDRPLNYMLDILSNRYDSIIFLKQELAHILTQWMPVPL